MLRVSLVVHFTHSYLGRMQRALWLCGHAQITLECPDSPVWWAASVQNQYHPHSLRLNSYQKRSVSFNEQEFGLPWQLGKSWG